MDKHMIEREAHAGQSHSEMILSMVGEILLDAGISLKNLDGIAFGAGPGSFTGLRIACGVAQGLAYGAGLKVAGIGTLTALAAGYPADRVVACLDARMGEVYHAAFEKVDGKLNCIAEPGLYFPGETPALPGKNWAGSGSGFSAHKTALAERYAGQLDSIDGDARPHAREMARLALIEFESGRGVDPAAASPLYVRNKVALKESER